MYLPCPHYQLHHQHISYRYSVELKVALKKRGFIHETKNSDLLLIQDYIDLISVDQSFYMLLYAFAYPAHIAPSTKESLLKLN